MTSITGTSFSAPAATDPSKGQPDGPVDAVLQASIILYSAIQTWTEHVGQMVENLAQAQEAKNREIGDVNYAQAPANATQAQITATQNENMEAQKKIDDYHQQMLVLNKKSQMKIAQANSNVDLLQQLAGFNIANIKAYSTVGKAVGLLLKRAF